MDHSPGRSRLGLWQCEAMIVDSASRAAELIAPYFSEGGRESVAVLHLDSERHLLGATMSAAGAADGVDLPIRDIMAAALRMDAAALIVAHNHPSGDPLPSEEDRRATRRLADALAPAGLRLLDHLVFAGAEWRSFREMGLI